MALNVIIAYDVSDNANRARVSARLSRYGLRIQKSVYQCSLTSEELRSVMADLRTLVDERRDTVHGFPVCRACSADEITIGQVKETMEFAYWIV